MAEQHGAGEDIKAKMREALDKKQAKSPGIDADLPVPEKAHGSEVEGSAPQMHRRKAGGGGS